MNVLPTDIPDVLLLEPRIFADERGFFFESWNADALNKILGFEVQFVQDNHSHSTFNVLRGMHYQIKQPQGNSFALRMEKYLMWSLIYAAPRLLLGAGSALN